MRRITAAVVAAVIALSGLTAATPAPTPAPTPAATPTPTPAPSSTSAPEPTASSAAPKAPDTAAGAGTSTTPLTDDGPGTAFGFVTAAQPAGVTTAGTPLPGVTVWAYDFSAHNSQVSTVTNASGYYHFSGLPMDVNLRFDAPDVGGRPSSHWYQQELVTPFADSHGVSVYTGEVHNPKHDQTISVPAVVSGSVRCEGCRLPDPAQLEVHLMAHEDGSSALSTDTMHPDTNGHYSFPNVLPSQAFGGYSIAVVFTGSTALPVTSNSGIFAVQAGQTVSKNVAIDGSAPAGSIVHVASPDGVQLRGTAAVVATSAHPASVAAGGVVSLFDFAKPGAAAVATATTDSAGRYAFDGLPAASYKIRFDYTSPSGSTGSVWLGQDVGQEFRLMPLSAGAFAVYDPALVFGATITGRVTCERCASPPPAGMVSIELRYAGFPNSDYRQTVADAQVAADGSFRFENVYPSADLDLRATFWGQTPSTIYTAGTSALFAIGESQTMQLDVLLPYLTPFDYLASTHIPEVYALYGDYLGRLPSKRDASWWADRLDSGASTTSSIAQSFVESDEYRLIRIDAAYRTILGRDADAPGRQNWLRAMQAGIITTDDIETSFYASDEWFQTHGNSNNGFARALYPTLLGRQASAADVSFWSALAARHGRAWVIAQFWDSTETISGRVSAMYNTYLGRVPDAAGLASWVGLALALGDSGLRAGLTSSGEYLARAHLRYVNP